jgi:hypothetical protein
VTSTYLNPVATTVEEAREIAKARLARRGSPPWWDIRHGYGKDYYVVPPEETQARCWRVDPGYESLGAYVEQVRL